MAAAGRVLKVILGLLLVLVLAYGSWTVYDNTLTPAALLQAAPAKAQPSPPGMLSPTAARALRAYGGEAVWKVATSVDSTVTVGGLLFQLKGAGIPAHARIAVDVRRPQAVIQPIDAAGDTGVLDGFSVKILSPSGKVLEQRADAREHLQNASINIRWDRLNLVYFLGYAFWGYYTLPYQLTRSDVHWTELGDGVLQADYGTDLPVHSRIQRFWFDPGTGLLRRIDYTPVAAARDARAAHVIFEHRVWKGIPYPSKRRVKISVQQYGWALPFPDFITIDVERWELR